jgi:hypothetical protein
MGRKKKPTADDPPAPKPFTVQAVVNGIVVADVVFAEDGVSIKDVFRTYPVENVTGRQREEATESVIQGNPRLYPPTDYEVVYAALWGERK